MKVRRPVQFTVEQLIEELNKIQDKTKPIWYNIIDGDRSYDDRIHYVVEEDKKVLLLCDWG